ncbi:hypothetical protein LTR37_001366 [Vermiconidia calcicola]|uniref:Uncharacterized protein n=1 Tax=Vermiconidia calcicola TaxID=1690605 RepID=A0ACC3NVZ1_9PEZI|nr:hypothetical protein LTR37_001366 [Vermiconidia calcicola]
MQTFESAKLPHKSARDAGHLSSPHDFYLLRFAFVRYPALNVRVGAFQNSMAELWQRGSDDEQDIKEEDELRGGDNYLRWLRRMRIKLEADDVWMIVSGKRAKPQGDEAHIQSNYTIDGLDILSALQWWEQEDQYAKASIISSLPGGLNLPDGAELTAGELWLYPSAHIALQAFCTPVDSTGSSRMSIHQSVRVCAQKANGLARLYGGEYRIPSWIFEKRFIDCIQEVHGSILETFPTLEDQSGAEYGDFRRLYLVCSIVRDHEAVMEIYRQQQPRSAQDMMTGASRRRGRRQRNSGIRCWPRYGISTRQ